MKITDKCTFSDDCEVKKITCKKLSQYKYCLIDRHLSGPISARLKEFYCMSITSTVYQSLKV